MLKVGLTGGIGSGKSVVAEIFKVLGIPVFDADSEAKKVMLNDPILKQLLIAEFGQETFVNGELNRAWLGAQVFNNVFKLDKLNALVHPATIAAAEKWIADQTSPYVIKEAALLFESGSAGNLDVIIGVTAPEHIRMQRVMQRDHLSSDEIKARMSKQIPDVIKMKLCDFVLVNDEQILLTPQVIALHQKLLDRAG